MPDIRHAPRRLLPRGTTQPSCAKCQIHMARMPMILGLVFSLIAFSNAASAVTSRSCRKKEVALRNKRKPPPT